MRSFPSADGLWFMPVFATPGKVLRLELRSVDVIHHLALVGEVTQAPVMLICTTQASSPTQVQESMLPAGSKT